MPQGYPANAQCKRCGLTLRERKTAAHLFGCCSSVQVVVTPGTGNTNCSGGPCDGYTPPERKEEKQVSLPLKPSDNTLTISPNPTNGRVNIQWSGNSMGDGNKLFRIFDLNGQLKGQITVTSENDTGLLNLNLTQLPQGIYFVQLIGKKRNITGKIFKQ